MDENTIATVLITAITVLGSASAWRFYEKREERKRIEEVKSKKLLFARNNHFAPTNASPNNLNQLFLLRR